MPDTSDPAQTNIPPEIVEANAVANVKTVAEGSALAANALHHQMVGHFSRLNQIAENSLQNGTALSQVMVAEAAKSIRESDLGEQLAQIMAGAKAGQTIPPVSAPSPVTT